MKEVVVYNTYYEEFEAFKEVVLGFFDIWNALPEDSELGRQFKSRIRDKFRVANPIC